MATSSPHALSTRQTEASLGLDLAEIARSHGFEGAVYMHLGHGVVSLQESTLCSRPLRIAATQGFDADHYGRRNYLASDPLAARAYSAYVPFAWSLVEFDEDRPGRPRLRGALAGWGMGAGVVAPVQDHALGPALLNVFRREALASPAEFDRGGLLMAAAAIHVKAIASLAPCTAMSEASLSPREISVLRLAALGRTEQETAAVLALSRRGVQFHLSRAVEKLNASNKTAAVALALNAGLIRLDP